MIMWSEIFRERIKKEKIPMIRIAEIMEISETAFHAGFKKDSFKTQNILKVYKHYDWDLNELKADNINIIYEKETKYFISKKTEENNSIPLDKLEKFYEKRLEEKDSEIKYLRKQLDKLIKNNNAMEGGAAASA